MEREVLVTKTVHNIKQLPTTRIQEINNFVEFILRRADDSRITEGLQELSDAEIIELNKSIKELLQLS